MPEEKRYGRANPSHDEDDVYEEPDTYRGDILFPGETHDEFARRRSIVVKYLLPPARAIGRGETPPPTPPPPTSPPTPHAKPAVPSPPQSLTEEQRAKALKTIGEIEPPPKKFPKKISLPVTQVALDADQIKEEIQRVGLSLTPDSADTLGTYADRLLQDIIALQPSPVYQDLSKKSMGELERIWGHMREHYESRDRPFIVGIDGFNGAGKSTIAEWLMHYLRAYSLRVIRIDVNDFYLPLHFRRGYRQYPARDYYMNTLDYKSIRNLVLLPLRKPEDLRYRSKIYDLHREEYALAAEAYAPTNAIVLVEGMFMMRPEIRGLLDYRLYVNSPLNLVDQRIIRATKQMPTTYRIIKSILTKRCVPAQIIYNRQVLPHKYIHALIDNQAEYDISFLSQK